MRFAVSTFLSKWLELPISTETDRVNVQYMLPFSSRLIALLKDIRLFTFYYGSIMIVSLFIIYAVLSNFYGTHDHDEKAWSVSIIYISGLTPTVVLILSFTLLNIFLVHYLINTYSLALAATSDISKYQNSLTNADDVTTIEAKLRERLMRNRNIGRLVIIISINSLSILFANIVYIYIFLRYDVNTQNAAAFFLSMFKVVWNNVVLPNLISNKRLRFGAPKLDVTRFMNSIFGSEFLFLTLNLIFNTILAPCIANALTDPLCFRNIFNSQSNIPTDYSFGFCTNADYVKKGCKIFNFLVSSSYPVAFAYYYQCSFSLVTNYSDVFITMYTLR